MSPPQRPVGENLPILPLTVTTRNGPAGPVVVPVGEVDPSTVDLLKAAVEGAAHEASVIEIDCTDLRFLDSSGVNVIATVLRRYELGEGPKLVVSNAAGIVARVLEVSGVAGRLAAGHSPT